MNFKTFFKQYALDSLTIFLFVYSFRRSVSYSTAPCALRIDQAHPDDSAIGNEGEWECHLQVDNDASGLVTTMG